MPLASAPVPPLRVLTKDDLARLPAERRKPQLIVQKLRDQHHYLAQLFAMGMSISEVARTTGKTYAGVRNIRNTPAFDELVTTYRQEHNAQITDAYAELVTGHMVRAEMALGDKLEEHENGDINLSVSDLLKISRDGADRMGYGKRTTNVNINADFGAAIERAIARSGKTIEGRVVTSTLPQPLPVAMASPEPVDDREDGGFGSPPEPAVLQFKRRI